MEGKTNKDVVIDYFKAQRDHDWDKFVSTIHPEISVMSHFHTDEEWRDSNYYHFLRLLEFDNSITSFNHNAYTNRDEYLLHRKKLAEMTMNWQLHDIVADGDKVWLNRSYVMNDPNDLGLDLYAIVQIEMKERKIYRSASNLRFFNTLAKLGKLIYARDSQNQIDNYLGYLAKIGLIQD